MHVLEHFDGPSGRALVEAAFRALAPGGRIFLEVPNMANFITAPYARWADYTHRHGYTIESLSALLLTAGFRIHAAFGVARSIGSPGQFVGHVAQRCTDAVAWLLLKANYPRVDIVAAPVIGIVGDTREAGLDRPAGDGIYLALAQNPLLRGTVIARTNGDPMDVARTVVQRMYEVDPEQPAGQIRSLETVRADSIAAPRLTARLLGIFALVALVIAATGIGGVIALAVSQRTHEFGVRMAIGARPVNILLMVLGQGLWLAAVGVGLGLLGALALTRILKGLLFEVAPTDPLTFAAVALVLVLAAVVACLLPARRAAGVDPLIALRVE